VVSAAPRGLLALGMPGCAACLLLPASLAEVGRSRPDLTIAIGEFATADDWASRERLMWPRGIHVSRSSVPAMALLIDGEVVATRPGGGPASVIDAWLAPRLGPAAHPLTEGLTPAEAQALEGLSGLIARHRSVKGRREASLDTG
jgi:hypothetical protein